MHLDISIVLCHRPVRCYTTESLPCAQEKDDVTKNAG